MEALTFPRGNIYQIICQDGHQALRIATDNHNEYNQARIIGTQPNPHDLGQLWMIEKVGHKDDQFEIVNCQSNFVWDEEGKEIRLRFGKQNRDQLFKVQKAGYSYWFKTDTEGQEAVQLQGYLKYKAFDPNNLSQLFYIVPVDNCDALKNTCVLVNVNSGKALEIPDLSWDTAQRLIINQKTKRFNQRWRWIKQGNGYLLENVYNRLCADIFECKVEAKSKVVQFTRTNAANQLWKVQLNGVGEFRIESLHAPYMCLAVKDDDVDNQGKIEIRNFGQSIGWRIEGYIPHN